MNFLSVILVLIAAQSQADTHPATSVNEYLESIPLVWQDIQESVDRIAKRNNLTSQDVFSLIAESHINSRRLFECKGGTAIIGNNVYANLISEKNQLSFRDGDEINDWIGRNRNISELVILAGNKVVGEPIVGIGRNDLQFVLFEPDRVASFHWGTLNGIVFRRDCR